MIPQPPAHRNTMTWHVFEKISDDTWKLILLVFYANLFSYQEKTISEKSFDTRISQSGKTKTFYLQNLTVEDEASIHAFIETYRQHIVLGCGSALRDHFSDELDFCIALDKLYEKFNQRTEIGQIEYEAKYHPTKAAIQKLTIHLETALHRIRKLMQSSSGCISFIPSDPNKDFCLPKILAKNLALTLGNTWFGTNRDPLVDASLSSPKNPMKDASIQEKIAEWGRLVDNRSIVLSQSVMGKTVFLIDDLYQSGVTLWSYAKYLKLQGAVTVIGVVCVKSASDTDNIGSSSTSGDMDDSWTETTF